MARIGLDSIHISLSGKGLSRFEECFVQALASRDSPHEFIVFIDDAMPLSELPSAPHLHYVQVPKSKLLVWEQIRLPDLMRHYSVDMLQTCSDRIPMICSKPIILFAFEIPDYRHDARQNGSIYQTLSDNLTGRWYPYSLRKASKILVSSEATSRDLVTHYQVPLEKLALAYPGVSGIFRPCTDFGLLQTIREDLQAPDGYILHFSSTRDPRDNTRAALRAFHGSIQALNHKRKLVVGGSCDMQQQGLADLVRELNLSDRLIFPGFVSDRTLVELFWAADAYLDPSLYEGFGFQVLEAMACGTPVICSNTTSLPEIVGDAGITASPTDTDALCAALVKVLSDPILANSMRDRGRERATHFSWDNTIDAAMNAYAEFQ